MNIQINAQHLHSNDRLHFTVPFEASHSVSDSHGETGGFLREIVFVYAACSQVSQ